jgi:hypothetical protein
MVHFHFPFSPQKRKNRIKTTSMSLLKFYKKLSRGAGQSVTECVVKSLHVVKVIGSKPAGTKNPTMLRVGVAQAGCDPRVILTA